MTVQLQMQVNSLHHLYKVYIHVYMSLSPLMYLPGPLNLLWGSPLDLPESVIKKYDNIIHMYSINYTSLYIIATDFAIKMTWITIIIGLGFSFYGT